MAILYGVLRGRPDRFKREDNGSSPHLQIRVLEDNGQPWRIAVNVQSKTGSHVAFWMVDPLAGHPVLAALSGRSQGFTTLPANAGQALDYVKAPLFDVELGRVLPPSGAASADDLQDLLSMFLEQCKAAGGEIFAFGAKFTQNLHKPIDIEFGNTDGLHGIHDIHMNQGNVGDFEDDNGVFHDGGLILKFPDRFMGLFLAFQSQRVPTDAAGAAAPGAHHHRADPDGHAEPDAGGRLDDLHRARVDQPGRRGRGTREHRAGQPGHDVADAEPLAAPRQERPRHAD